MCKVTFQGKIESSKTRSAQIFEVADNIENVVSKKLKFVSVGSNCPISSRSLRLRTVIQAPYQLTIILSYRIGKFTDSNLF